MENLLLNIFIEDIKKNNNPGLISQLSIITIKSLFPSKDIIGNYIDKRRFNEELNLWKDYRVGENASLISILDEPSQDIYYNKSDYSLYSRVIPIVIANKSYEVIECEVIKNILFTTGNIASLFENITLAKMIYIILEKNEDIIANLKEYIIQFSQSEFLEKYKDQYRFSLDEYPGIYKIDFERKRISILNLINGSDSKGYPILLDIIGVLQGKSPSTIMGSALEKCIMKKSDYSKIDRFYMNMNSYLLKLRKSRIDPEALIIDEYILPDIFDFNENEIFFHSLLKESKVIKREVRDKTLTSLVQTKSGLYLFKRDLI